MKPIKWFSFFLLLCLMGCKKEPATGIDETKSFIKADIDGIAYSTNNVFAEKDPFRNELLFFSSLNADSISIGIQLTPTTPAFQTGTYSFRPAATTGIKFLDFDLEHVSTGTKVKWAVEQLDETLDYFSVERSEDGRTFSQIGTVVQNPGSGIVNYGFDDNLYEIARYYYRIKAVYKDGKFIFSVIRSIFTNTNYYAFYGEKQKLIRGINGTIKITEHNRTNRIVYGSFSFDAIVSSGVTKKIRNGSFKIIY